MTTNFLLEVGRISKPHGLAGDVIVDLITDRQERLAPKAQLQTDRGVLTVTRSQDYQNKFIVHFAEIKDRTEAEKWRDVVLKAEPIDDPNVIWVHDLIGKQVIDQNGIDRGKVVSVVANPASDLLELENGTLIPMTFVTKADEVVKVNAPEGLFDIE